MSAVGLSAGILIAAIFLGAWIIDRRLVRAQRLLNEVEDSVEDVKAALLDVRRFLANHTPRQGDGNA